MRCAACGVELPVDQSPAFDAITGVLRCDTCARKERHVAKKGKHAWLHIPSQEVRPA